MKNIVINVLCILSIIIITILLLIDNRRYKLTDKKFINMANTILDLNGYNDTINEDSNIKMECHVDNRYVYSFDYEVEGNYEANRYVIGFLYDNKNNRFYYNYFNPLGIINDKCINTIDNGTGETD